MKSIQYITSLLLAVFLLSCNKWLDVQPEDRLKEDQLYSTRQGFLDALNGLYIKSANAATYGDQMTLSTLEMFAQRYHTSGSSTTHLKAQFGLLNYADPGVEGSIGRMWEGLYSHIANVNRFLSSLEKFPGVLQAEELRSFRGQALGLRAWLHLDVLRLFGPVYDSPDSVKALIPYYTKLQPEGEPNIAANAFMDKVLADLEEAGALLAGDAVLTEGSSKLHHYRMNLVAVTALKARASLWRGNRSAAYAYAKAGIEQAKDVFPWVLHDNIASSPDNPDRIFSTELLFALFNSQLYESYNAQFSPELYYTSLLAGGPTPFIDITYESNQRDYRYIYSWPIPGTGAAFRTFFKYADVKDKDKAFRFTTALVRKSELYYIVAETAEDPAEALEHLNMVRRARYLDVDITDPAQLEAQLLKEYQKEFFGEGQMWFYYKRKKAASVISPNVAYPSTGMFTIVPEKYVLPKPLSETSSR
ncbi:RagB/SusD family nutrient uptake outer membrane protein [Chitinophaga sp.]|uniref:RagB/SusD family nutrient uptake outer membrane protein n=1 Tax=Chitinophaga sp. TaxID=1869181 RepID=UPI002603DFDF|nr:RagB/SusD family nutrient uptake outer membrane protein [uncultured Chitinophaga sp.]